MSDKQIKEDQVRNKVREGYTAIAKKGVFSVMPESGCAQGGGCCGSTDFDLEKLVDSIGYSAKELEHTPESANMGLSCGNPTVLAQLKQGEVVLDLGSGGGFDVFIAGPKVGPEGRVIGVDMTPEMITKARNNTKIYNERTNLNNVEFRLGEIEYLPVADKSVDVVISNCVLNLSPNKEQVWKEIYRVLKPGGRFAISDLALLKPLPDSITNMIEALVGCVAGAVLVEELNSQAKTAGFKEIKTELKSNYIETLVQFEDPLYQKILELLPSNSKLKDYITSADLSGTK